MAYKFQIGDARLSGSLVQEGNIEIADGGTIGSDTTADVISIASNGAVTFTDNSQNINIAGHDAGTNGLALGGTLVTATAAEINLLDTAAGDSVVNGKAVIYGDAGEVSAASLKVSDLTDNRVLIAGSSGEVEDSANLTFDGTILAGATLEISAAELSGTLEFMLDVAPNGGIGMTPFNNSANVSDLAISASYLAAAAVADGDEFLMLDSDGSPKREAIADLATLFAGNGLSAASSVMALDLNELGTATVSVANDSIAIIDADDSNGSKKESIADLVAAIAGDGLTATSGVLSVDGAGAPAAKADGDTLVEGYNYFADLSADATVTMPASPEAGDVVTVKAKDLTSGANIIINRAGSHLIDGETSIRIESPFGAVSMVYVAANDWRIV